MLSSANRALIDSIIMKKCDLTCYISRSCRDIVDEIHESNLGLHVPNF
jgi:hypothetical protein